VKAIDVHEYDQADGLESTGGVKRSRSVISDSAGRIWFSLNSGLSVVSPSQVNDNSAPALPHIEAVFADGSPVDFRQPFRISTKQQKTTFQFVALSLANSERVRYRYRLDGFDHGWSDPVASREVTYTNLGAASYRFRVIASNSDGQWNDSEDSVAFEVEPTVWQTWWFRTGYVALILLLVWCVYLYRLHQLAKEFNIRLEERVAERTRVARELHDTMLQSFQGVLLLLHAGVEQLPDRPDIDKARKRLETAIDHGRQAIEEGRGAVQGLRSSTLEGNDLMNAIKTLGEDIAADPANQSPAALLVAMEGPSRNLHPIVRDEVYRIAGEGLRNAFRHADAKEIEVEIHYDDRRLRVRVRDDGKGIDPEILSGDGRKGHYGLSGMRERAQLIGGQLKVWSKLDSGTELELSVPAEHAYTKRPWLGEKFLAKLSRRGAVKKR
jgi:signal transduction histidine kinase